MCCSSKPKDESSRDACAETLVLPCRVAQKEASEFAKTKHAVHHDGPQRSEWHSWRRRRGPGSGRRPFPEKEGLAALLFSGIQLEDCLAVPNTFKGGEATFSSTKGTLTQIDYIAALAEMLLQADQCWVLVRTAIRLQVVKSIHRHDHWRVIAVFQECSRRERTRQEPAWSAQAINACWTAGRKRPEVVGAVVQALEEKKAKFDRH